MRVALREIKFCATRACYAAGASCLERLEFIERLPARVADMYGLARR